MGIDAVVLQLQKAIKRTIITLVAVLNLVVKGELIGAVDDVYQTHKPRRVDVVFFCQSCHLLCSDFGIQPVYHTGPPLDAFRGGRLGAPLGSEDLSKAALGDGCLHSFTEAGVQ